ncbi:MAG: DUF1264 domain-containing protein [Candidatus Vogelbacteria bacterium]|nr:DUF1264 domain-containing protein [Candidatus Vogelbacteria bacterium]
MIRLLLAAMLGFSVFLFIGFVLSSHPDHQASKHVENWGGPRGMHLYLCAVHLAKDDSKFQVVAHHYCGAHGNKVHQCVVYDSRGENAKLLGVEYIISQETYVSLPEDEKKYWHPHDYEIDSGQLVAPDEADDGDSLLQGLRTTWGKTWHTWRDPKTALPFGEPRLMWSATADGQVNPELIITRDREFGIESQKIGERRRQAAIRVKP